MAKNENEPSLSTLVSSSGTIKKSHGHNNTQPGNHHHHHHHHHRHHNPGNNCAPSISTEASSADSLNSVSTTGSSITSASLGMAGTPIPTTHSKITKMKCPALGQKNKIQSYQQQQQRHRSHHHGSHHRSSSRGHHRQNVAIATQVISPSAIGGSLKLSGPRRICQHYDIDAEDDDSDGTGLFGKKKTLPWGKLSCYGASIGIIILIMTGVVLAVGYMQSEKQRIMSQSQKLSQEWNNTHPAPTTWRPKLTFHRAPNVSVTIPDTDTSASSPPNIMTRLRFSSKIAAANDSVTNMTGSIGEDVANLDLASNNAETKLKENIVSKEMVNKGQERESQEDSDESDEDEDDDNDEDEGDELEIYEPQVGLLEEQSRTQESRNGEQAPSEITRAMSRMDNNDILQQLPPLLLPTQSLLPVSTTSNDNSKFTEIEERHKSPSEVKVLPPKDFKFNGYSFEIPIYTQNSSTFSVGNSNNSSETNQQSTLPPFVLSDTIHHTTSKSPIPDTQDSTSTIQLQKFDIGNPLQVDLDNFNSSNPNPDSNPYVLKGNFNYTNNILESNSHIDTSPTTNEENFEALKKFLDSFKSTEEEPVNEGTTDIDNKLPAPEITPNSFNIGSSSLTNLQTELFSNDDEEGDVNNALSLNSEDDDADDDDHDSEMSASNDKIRGRNHRPPKVKTQPTDNMYTPRPGSKPHYPDRPPRIYSAKTFYTLPSNNLYPGSNKNGVTTGDYNQNSNSNSDFGSYELASTPVTSSTPVKQSSTQTGNNNNHETTTISTLSVSDFQLSSPPTPISLNLLNPVTASPYSASTDSSNFHFDFSQLTTPSPLHGATPTPHFPDVLSKRTFNFGYDSSGYGGGSASNFNSNNNNYNNNNPFSDILGSQSSITSSIGSATSTGASLGYNANYNFDSFNPYINTGSGGSNSNPNSNFPSGTIPLDLASSYIQASNPGGNNRGGGNSNNNNPGGFNLQASGSSSLNNYDFSSPYGSSPGSGPISLSQLIQNSADHGTRNSGYSSPGLVATGSNQAPQYNTITQGIHLLSLLHGNIPEHLSDNYPSASNNDYGQQINQQYADNPQFQLAGLTGYSGGNGGNSNNNAYSNNLQSSSSNYNPYIVAAESRNLHTSGGGRYDVSSGNKPADQQTSFSQNIVAKLADFSNINKKHVADSVSASSDSVPTVLGESQAFVAEKKLTVPAPPQNLKSNEKIPDMDTAASEILLISTGRTDPSNNAVVSEKSIKPSINFAKKLAKIRRVGKEESDNNERGLKSGFYI